MKKRFITGLAIFISAYAFAQEKSVQAFSLKEAIAFAVKNNVAVKNARLDEQKAKAFNWEILTTGLPQLNGNVEYDYYFKPPQVPAVSQIFSDPRISTLLTELGAIDTAHVLSQLKGGVQNVSFVLPNNLTAGLQLNQLIFDGRYFVGLKARNYLYNTSRLSREMSEQDIHYAVAKAYYQGEAALEAKSLLNDNLKLVDKLLEDTRAVFAQGLTEELDVNRLELAKTTLESQINLQNQMSEVGLANLKFQMGLPLDNEIILKDKLDDLKDAEIVQTENKFDEKNRIEYELLTNAVALKGFDAAQKRGGYYPTVSAFLNYSENAQTEGFADIFKGESYIDANGNPAKTSPWFQQGLVGLSIKVPIFDSGLKGAQVKQAKLEELKSKNDLENFKNASRLQYESALSGFNSALADEVNTQKMLDLSQKIFNTNRAKFQQGAGSSFELQQSEQEFTGNQLKHVQSIMNILNAKAELDKAMGVR